MLRAPTPPLGTHRGASHRLAPITGADLDELADAYWRTYLDTEHEFAFDDAHDDVERYFAGGYGPPVPSASLAIRVGERIVGAVLTVREAPYPDVPPTPFVIDLFVVPQHRRVGLGRALMVAAIGAVPDETVGLRVESDNVPAAALYRELGFVEVEP